jgi:4-amino-4-deoxy-L-arabinose transferase-like glycosyltransferase
MFLALFLGIVNLLKLWLARFLPLLGDEAYYNLWSKHLALSYTDHPPIIAYLHWTINFILGQNEFGVRVGAILCLLISSWLIYLVGKEAFGKKVGVASAVLFNLIPTYFAGGLFLTPEQPLLIFWLLSMYWAVKILKTQQKAFWYPLGISIGLGLLSKFPMLLFLPGFLFFLIISQKNRYWLTKKEPYLALFTALAIFSPVMIWNFQHGFPSLLHHGARIGSPDYLNNLLNFFVLQFLMYSPPLFIFTCITFFYEFWKNKKAMDNFTLLFITLSLPAFLAFLVVSPLTLIGGHWTSIIYLGIMIVLCHQVLISAIKPFRIAINLGIIILINVLFVGYYAFLHPVPEELKGKAYTINQELAQYLKDSKVDHVFSNQMGVASLVAFYGKTEVHMPQGRWRQFDIWGQPALKKGEDILYFSFGRPETYKKLKPLFRQVKIDPQKRLFIKDSNISEKTQIFICKGFKGGRLP